MAAPLFNSLRMAGQDPALLAMLLGSTAAPAISQVQGYMDADNFGELTLNSLIANIPLATGVGGAGIAAALDPVLREKMTAVGQVGQGMYDEWNIERNYNKKVEDLERRAAVANQAGDVPEQMNILKERLVVEAEYAETIGNVRSSIGSSANAPTPEMDRAVQEEAERQAKRTEPEVTVAMDAGDKMPKQESTADKILKNRMRRMGAAGLIGSVAGLPIASALMQDRDQG